MQLSCLSAAPRLEGARLQPCRNRQPETGFSRCGNPRAVRLPLLLAYTFTMSAILALPIFVIILVAIAAFIIHFLPAFIAGKRHSKNFVWILLINIFFGWTLIGWIVALVWALNDTPRYSLPYNR
jgi:hypothetical protein